MAETVSRVFGPKPNARLRPKVGVENGMKYLLLAYGDEQELSRQSPGEREAGTRAGQANAALLRESGYLLAGGVVQQGSTTTTLRLEKGELTLSDGPVSGAAEQLRELFFINARDLNEAIQVAAKMPQARQGPIEVRAMVELDADLV